MKYPKSNLKSKVRSPKSEVIGPCDWLTAESAFWFWGEEAGVEAMVMREDASAAPKPPFDLEERTAQFGEAVVRFAKKIQRGPAMNRLIDQLVGAGTSIGANYSEAKDGVSRKDFKNRVGTSRKESKETMFFLRMIAAADDSLAPEARQLWREAKELNLIFGAIWRK